MKKLCFMFVVMTLSVSGANAATTCSEGSKLYESCKPGYYYGGEDGLSQSCDSCPSVKLSASVQGRGTSVDKNTGGKTSCYLPAGTELSDDTGTFKYTADCYYAN